MSMLTLERPVEELHVTHREAISRASLEDAIANAVRKADPICEAFGGVFVERLRPQSRQDANWDIMGVRFGRADRAAAADALTTVVERMQYQFLLSNDD
jgi:hypothetical protein